jgi:O-antigen/teichoic acid export membrane protein
MESALRAPARLGIPQVSEPAGDSPTRRPSTLRPLVASRVLDQAGLGLGSLLLARALGPDAFAPVAALFVVYSLGLQISDFGVGFAVYRSAPGHSIACHSLTRMRRADLVIASVLVIAGALVGGDAGAVIAIAGPVWFLSAEVYVRKAGALKQRHPRRVAAAEITSSGVFLAGSAVLAVLDAPVAVIGLLFVVKLGLEIALIRAWRPSFSADGDPARSGAEWLGQVMTYLVANVDYVLVAWLLGPEDLSVYVIAFRFAAAVPAFLAGPITQTSFVEYAAAGEHERQAIYGRLLARIVTLGLAGVAALVVVAPLLPVVLGSAWDDVTPVMVVLAIAVPWRLLLGTTVALAITRGRARPLVVWETGRLIVMSIAVIVASAAGLIWVAAAVSAGAVLTIGLEHLASTNVAGLRAPRWFLPATAVTTVLVAGVAVVVAP